MTDAPLPGNDSVEGSVEGVALRHSAYTWWAMHRPVSTAARALARPLTALVGSPPAAAASSAARHASRPAAAPSSARAA